MSRTDGTAFGAYAAEGDEPTDYDEIELALRAYAPNIQLDPGERTGGALPVKRGKLLSRSLTLLIPAGAGAAVYQAPDYWLARWTEASALASAALEQIRPAVQPQADPVPPPPPARETPSAPAPQPPATPPVTEMAAEKPVMEAALPPAATPADRPPEPSAKPEPLDPLRKRAAAAGLHPDLSRALLAELTDADFHNARTAVQTALAGTPDTQDYVWPTGKAAKPGLAVFTVTFVQGAVPGCRRYVVTIAKKGWLTTAPARETCAARPKNG